MYVQSSGFVLGRGLLFCPSAYGSRLYFLFALSFTARDGVAVVFCFVVRGAAEETAMGPVMLSILSPPLRKLAAVTAVPAIGSFASRGHGTWSGAFLI